MTRSVTLTAALDISALLSASTDLADLAIAKSVAKLEPAAMQIATPQWRWLTSVKVAGLAVRQPPMVRCVAGRVAPVKVLGEFGINTEISSALVAPTSRRGAGPSRALALVALTFHHFAVLS